MSKWTILYGSSLAALGVSGFVATGAKHKTALIPAALGVAEIGLGLVARQRAARAFATGAAAVLGGIGVAATARALGGLPAALRDKTMERRAAVLSKSAMAGISVAYLLGLAVLRTRR